VKFQPGNKVRVIHMPAGYVSTLPIGSVHTVRARAHRDDGVHVEDKGYIFFGDECFELAAPKEEKKPPEPHPFWD
jgi:hypothetical protein